MITSACDTFFKYSFSPTKKANELREASIKDNGTWGEALTARALFIAQAIVSLVAIPLVFLGLIFASALALCIEGKEAAVELAKYISFMSLLNIAVIPTSLISAFAPHSLQWEAPVAQVFQCLKNCFSD
jgi:uncharacterized membrane protein (UPF0136 family)